MLTMGNVKDLLICISDMFTHTHVVNMVVKHQ